MFVGRRVRLVCYVLSEDVVFVGRVRLVCCVCRTASQTGMLCLLQDGESDWYVVFVGWRVRLVCCVCRTASQTGMLCL